MTPGTHVANEPVAFSSLAEPVADLINRLMDALQDTRVLAAISNEGDPWYAKNEGVDAKEVLTRAYEVILDAESFRKGTSDI